MIFFSRPDSSLGSECALIKLDRSLPFHLLTCSSFCRPQFVSALSPSLSFVVLNCSFLSCLQVVSAPHSVASRPYPSLPLPLPSPGSECSLLGLFCSVLTCPSLCQLQLVSAPHFTRSLSFHALTCPFFYRLQFVSASRLLVVPCPDLSHSRPSPVCECHLVSQFPSISLFCPSIHLLQTVSVPSTCLSILIVLTCLLPSIFQKVKPFFYIYLLHMFSLLSSAAPCCISGHIV